MSVFYAGSTLAKGSKALELYTAWKKTGKPEDKKALDWHMKQVAAEAAALLLRYK